MSATKQQRLAEVMRWVAWIIGVIIGLGVTAFYLLWLVFTYLDLHESVGADIFVLVSFVIGLIGCFACWWWEWLAGILWVLACLVLGSGIILIPSGELRVSVMTWSWLGLPYLIAGVLLLLSWRLSRKTA